MVCPSEERQDAKIRPSLHVTLHVQFPSCLTSHYPSAAFRTRDAFHSSTRQLSFTYSIL